LSEIIRCLAFAGNYGGFFDSESLSSFPNISLQVTGERRRQGDSVFLKGPAYPRATACG